MKPLTILIAPLALSIAACGDDTDPQASRTAEQGGEVAGDVLGGTISDDMLPLEELRSQSPPAERATTTVPLESSEGETVVETTIETNIGEDSPPPLAPPEPPSEPSIEPE
ncbi:MAG: hypothetical protein AAF941_06165 [Pseudomonadota bacterium]